MSRPGEIATPTATGLELPAMGMQQKLAIAAAHQGLAIADQADGSVSKVMGFPGAFGQSPLTEQSGGDGAIAGPRLPPIQSPKGGHQPVASSTGQGKRTGAWTSIHEHRNELA